MPSLLYNSLQGLSGVGVTESAPASSRSRDQNRFQRLAFEIPDDERFTGIVHVQCSIGDPTIERDLTWFDIAEMDIDDECGSWSYEYEGEYASVRVACREGNYRKAAHGSTAGSVGLGGDFTINGISVIVAGGDSIATVLNTINTNANIIADGTIVADVGPDGRGRIYTTGNADLVLVDSTNTPLADLGFTPGTYTGGNISKISVLR